ncbi:MAG: type I methionyl aminopeptidase [Planctomycetes bacterium RBG_16_64_10]|nr:MAG: type I methionyl aminopeptidase [Planctomycetes bacterium RBG_16_64_10]
MRKAGVIVWEAHQVVAKLIRPGITTAALDAAVETLFRARHAVPLFKDYPHADQDKPPFPGVICTSVNEEVVHGIPGPRRLKVGDVVSIDTGCRLNGWCADAAVTHAVGRVEPRVQELLDVTRGALELAVEFMESKGLWSEVAAEMAKFVADHGFSTVECFVGHGIGREMHEEPQVPNLVNRQLRGSGDFPLEPGLVIAVEPMVNLGTKRVKSMPDHWTQATLDGKPSAHFEHTIAVTADGPIPLTAAPSREEIAALAG